jgi:hypothetical protein
LVIIDRGKETGARIDHNPNESTRAGPGAVDRNRAHAVIGNWVRAGGKVVNPDELPSRAFGERNRR